ncbi:MAG: ATPase domain-containing protein, partial [Halobacteriota archaeon]|nr:ATPase domain-containing protein [Halobacteriota archaeon]
MTRIKRYPIGCNKIDELLGGGFEAGTLTQMYGQAGSGKTNICIQLAIESVRSG